MAKAKLGKSQSSGTSEGALARAKFLLVASKKRPLSREVKSLPQRLALAREEASIPSLQLDELAGVAGGRTSRAENGKRIAGLPLDTVIKMARALGVRTAWLALGEEPMRAPAPQQESASSAANALSGARSAFAEGETKKMQQGPDGGGKRQTGE